MIEMTEEERLSVLRDSTLGLMLRNVTPKQAYDMISTQMEPSDFQFKRLFCVDRQQGKTYAKYMSFIIQCYEHGNLQMKTQRIAQSENDHMLLHRELKEFERFLQEYSFISYSYDAMRDEVSLEFDYTKYTLMHPELSI